MAPKNKKKNSFYFFMKEMKEREARKGHIIPISQMANYAHPIWKEMSLAEKEPYEEMARQYKNAPNLRGGKLASDGTRVEDNLQEEEEKKWRENKMIQDVKRYCNTDCATKEQFIDIAPKKLFYFLSFNILCCTEDDVYIPIEVGLVEYSIQNGILREYSKILHPGPAPQGYAAAAKQNSEEKHQISIFGEENSEKDMKVVYDEIKAFTNPIANDEYPPVFCERGDLAVTVGCLDWLSYIARERENVFEVWDATYLLLELRAGVGSPLPSYAIASDLLNKASFNYHPSTRCEFHEEKDLHFCALSYSKRLCYLLSDAVCNLFDIPLTEKHIPTRAVEEKSYTVTVFKESKPFSDDKQLRLDKTQNYYQNERREENKIQAPKESRPRQPASTCIAEEMTKLHLNITSATVPGHGIGRGFRRK